MLGDERILVGARGVFVAFGTIVEQAEVIEAAGIALIALAIDGSGLLDQALTKRDGTFEFTLPEENAELC